MLKAHSFMNDTVVISFETPHNITISFSRIYDAEFVIVPNCDSIPQIQGINNIMLHYKSVIGNEVRKVEDHYYYMSTGWTLLKSECVNVPTITNERYSFITLEKGIERLLGSMEGQTLIHGGSDHVYDLRDWSRQSIGRDTFMPHIGEPILDNRDREFKPIPIEIDRTAPNYDLYETILAQEELVDENTQLKIHELRIDSILTLKDSKYFLAQSSSDYKIVDTEEFKQVYKDYAFPFIYNPHSNVRSNGPLITIPKPRPRFANLFT